ncbi:MAG TPA: DUF1365 domain-containing protein [Burkholderiaceae bacterium]|nr:DUF1365 domain-containing protein [Burkholderiaceae bacterium]
MKVNTPHIGFGHVFHARARPQRHAFKYATYFLMLPMRSMVNAAHTTSVWQNNRSGLLSFFDSDHGDHRGMAQGGALAWLDELLRQHGIHDATGEAWLQTYPRVLGYTFKPVSFWYCHRADSDQGGTLRAIVAEVNNTFGEKHCYLLDVPRFGENLFAKKVFHVSPFNPVNGQYRFRFDQLNTEQGAQISASVDYFETTETLETTPTLCTRIQGNLQPITARTLRTAFWRYPAMTWGVLFHIHSQALRLWLKKVPFFHKPSPPEVLVSR